MTSFNVASIFIFFGLFSSLAGVVAVFAHRRLDLSARYWAVATLASGLTALLTVFRESLPPLLSYSVPIGINIATYVLMGHGLAILGQNPLRPAKFMDRLVYGTLVFILALELLRRFAGPDAALVLTSLGFGAAGIWSSAQAQALYLRTGCTYTLWMRWTLYALGVIQLIRLQGAFSGVASAAFDQDAVNLTIYSMIFVLGMLRYMFYLAIRLQEKVDLAKRATLVAEKANGDLRVRTAFISSAMQEAPVACIIADAQDNVLIGNREAEKLFGRTFQTLTQAARLPLKVDHLFVGMGASFEWTPQRSQQFFSRSGHGGDARCVNVRGEVFQDNQGVPQQVFVFQEEAVSAERAADLIKVQALELGCSLLLVRADGEVLAASNSWTELQHETGAVGPDSGSTMGLWDKLERLQALPSASSSLGLTARRDSASKALQMARRRSTQDGRSSSAFLRLKDGRHCDVIFDLLALTGHSEKALLVEIRVRPGPTTQVAPQHADEASLPVLPQSLVSRPAES